MLGAVFSRAFPKRSGLAVTNPTIRPSTSKMRFFQPFIKISLLGVGPTGRPLSVHRLRRPPGFGNGRFPHAFLASGPPAGRCRYTAFGGHLGSAPAGLALFLSCLVTSGFQ